MRLERNSLRGGAAGLLAVVALGLSAVLVLGWLSMLLRWPLVAALPDSAGMTADAFIGVFVDLCLWFVVVNALPLPPLAAGALLRATETMDEDLYRKCARGGAAILIVAIAAGWLTAALAPLHRALAGILF